MLIFHAHCQMGNQMFIYACARSLAKKLNVSYCLSSLDALDHFELDASDKWNNWKYLRFRILSKLPFLSKKFHHLQDQWTVYRNEMLKNKNGIHWYYGYFQGENYLFDNSEDLKMCFRPKPETREKFLNACRKWNLDYENDSFLVVHIRLRDYRTFGPEELKGPDMTLPWNYYQKQIRDHVKKDQKIFFLSDEIKTVESEMGQFYPDAVFSTEDALTDFQLIQHADTAVISHSSFAWWAAWLNEKPKKQIIVPEHFLGFKVGKEFPEGIIPSGWIKAQVYP